LAYLGSGGHLLKNNDDRGGAGVEPFPGWHRPSFAHHRPARQHRQATQAEGRPRTLRKPIPFRCSRLAEDAGTMPSCSELGCSYPR
jgi:hypothetical protein